VVTLRAVTFPRGTGSKSHQGLHSTDETPDNRAMTVASGHADRPDAGSRAGDTHPDYAALFARRVAEAGPPLMRAGAGGAAGVIPLTYGFPDPGSFPVADLIEASRAVLAGNAANALQYGPIAGPVSMLNLLVAKLAGEGISVTHDNLVVTSGGSQGIDLVTHLVINPGDAMLVEAPTFIGALQTFRNAEANLLEVPIDEHGLDVVALENVLLQARATGVRPKLLYTIPTFHNPAGVTLAAERRPRVIELAREYGFLILEDDAYSELRFAGEPLPSLYSLDPEGCVIQVRTFSKILAAGLRLGYLVTPAPLLSRLLQLKVDVGTSPFGNHVAATYAADAASLTGRLDAHILELRAIYRERRDAMLGALTEYAPDGVTWTVPEGGFFTWLTLPEGMDAAKTGPAAQAAGVSFIPGVSYFAGSGGARNLRLAFSYLPPDQLVEGVRRLMSVVSGGG
jgi:2-aminoadipate transaminase